MSDIRIDISNLNKVYNLYDQPIDRLKETLHPFKKQYHREFYALKNFDLQVPSGETIGIIGRNGAGKSTLLKLITGVLTPTSGEIKIEGKISALLELGTGFNPELNGMENVFFVGTLMGYSKKEMEKKLDEIKDFADIGEYINQPVKTYSSGMFARLAFAVAINVDPDILIVDEALAVGDINFQSRCFAKFNEFQQAGKTIIFVTHSLDTVIRYCQRAILLEEGEKIIEGSPKEVVDMYKKLQVNLYSDNDDKQELINTQNDVSIEKPSISIPEDKAFTDYFELNKDADKYGNGMGEIIDYGLFDDQGNPVQKLFSGDLFTVKMKVKFSEPVKNPIFAFTIKDLKGLEITGTNTHFDHVKTGEYKSGDIVLMTTTQKMILQNGAYTLSLGCTNYTAEDFVVYSRIYDALIFEVISHKDMVGLFDPGANIDIKLT